MLTASSPGSTGVRHRQHRRRSAAAASPWPWPRTANAAAGSSSPPDVARGEGITVRQDVPALGAAHGACMPDEHAIVPAPGLSVRDTPKGDHVRSEMGTTPQGVARGQRGTSDPTFTPGRLGMGDPADQEVGDARSARRPVYPCDGAAGSVGPPDRPRTARESQDGAQVRRPGLRGAGRAPPADQEGAARAPQMDRWKPILASWVAQDDGEPRKQRRTARRMHQLLQEIHHANVSEAAVRPRCSRTSNWRRGWTGRPRRRGLCRRRCSNAGRMRRCGRWTVRPTAG